MKTLQISFLAALCLAATGCQPFQVVDMTKTSKEVYAATRPDDVEILTVVPRDRKFEEVATISTNRWDPSDSAKMHNALREKASMLGANAVILTNSGITQYSAYQSFMWSTGTAIRYK